MSDAVKTVLGALNAGAEWDRDTVVPGAAARALRDHVASLEVSRAVDAVELDAILALVRDVHEIAEGGRSEFAALRGYLRSRYGSALRDAAAIAEKLQHATAKARGE